MTTQINGETERRPSLMKNRFLFNFVTKRTDIPVLAVGGLCSYNDEEWSPLSQVLGSVGFELEHCPLPGHGKDQTISLSDVHFEDCVRKVVLEIERKYRSTGKKVHLIGHSLGGPVVISAAERAIEYVNGDTRKLTAGAIVINCAPRQFIPKFAFKYLHHQYMMALFNGTAINLRDEDQKLLADGCDLVFGPESGHMLRKAAWGVRVPSLNSILPGRSLMVVASDDKIVPFDVAQKNIKFHDTMSFISSTGGHFCHFHKDSRDLISGQIANILRIWSKR